MYEERCCFRQISSLERRRREYASRKMGSSLREARRERKLLENGEMLGYIDMVLKQLRKASRDHRLLVEQRHLRESAAIRNTGRRFEGTTTSTTSCSVFYPRDSRRSTMNERRRELLEYPRTMRLLTKRKSYGDRYDENAGGGGRGEERGRTLRYGKSEGGAFERIAASSTCRDPNYVLDQEGFEGRLFDRQLRDWTGRSTSEVGGASTVV